MLKSGVALLGLYTLAAALAWGAGWRLPDRHNPWARLQVDEAPGWLTRHKLARLQREPATCLAVLAQAGFEFATLPDRETAAGCGYDNAVRISRTHLEPSAPFALSCPAAVSLALWERHSVLPAAERLLQSPVRRLRHYGSYACRNVGGREAGRRSEHAHANALDIAGFGLRDGSEVAVARHWGGGPPASDGDRRARFLHAVHRGACAYFGAVLGPDYNAAHADHFHLDRGRHRLCR